MTGANGPEVLRAAEDLVRRYENIVLSTDSHDLHRCSGITPGLAVVSSKFGAERAADVAARAERVLTVLVGGP